jgi:pantothenate kinase
VATSAELADLCRRIDALVSDRPAAPVIIGIAGAPGSGKTTLAQALVDALLRWPADWARPAPATGKGAAITEPGPQPGRRWIGSHVAHVPMDGFHLADVELDRLGRRDRKGAPDTFDAAGYGALLLRLIGSAEDVWAPAFDREVEQPIAGSIPILQGTRVIITEGNYLLLDDPQWATARESMDEVWFCDCDDAVRRERLIARHVRFGKTLDAAREWANGTDQRNAELIEASRHRADLIIAE